MKRILSLALCSGLLSISATAAKLDEATLRSLSNLQCENNATLIGVDTVNKRAFQKDKNKKEGWEITLNKFQPTGECADCLNLEGVFVLIVDTLPMPAVFGAWMTTHTKDAQGNTGLFLDYSFGAQKPQATIKDIACKTK